MFGIIVLLLAGLQLLAFGVWATIDPAGLLGSLGFAFEGAAQIEVRAFYGGLQTALGLLMCAAAFKPVWRGPGLVLVAACFAGIALVRGAAMLVIPAQSTFLNVALGVEIALVVLSLWALRTSRVV